MSTPITSTAEVETGTPVWHYHQITLANLVAAGASTTGTFTVHTLRAKGVIHAVKVVNELSLVGASVSAATVEVGIAGSLTSLIGASDVFTTTGSVYAASVAKTYSESGTTAIVATTLLTGANHSVLTVGHIGIYLLVSDTASAKTY